MDEQEMAKRFGFEPDDDDEKKAEKMAKFWAGHDEMKAKFDAATSAAGSAITASTMAAEPAKDKEPDADDKKAMSALSASLTAKGVTVPANATRATLMSLAALQAPASDDAKINALVDARLAAKFAADAAAAEKQERDQFVTMARTAKAPEYEIAALSALPIVSAREMASAKWGARPAHLFNALSHAGSPLGGPTAGGNRSTAPVANPEHRRDTSIGTIVESDGESAKLAREMAASKEPTVMSRVDATAVQTFGRVDSLTRTLAAQRLVDADHPHLMNRAG